MTEFTDLGLAAPILEALAKEGYTTPTPIQAQAIPSVLAGRDLLGIAQTGTGKTAAFALPILHKLAADRRPAPRKGCRVLVLSPTRELASQIADSFRAYGARLNLSIATVFGGVPHGAQIKALARGLDILVATPGRLVDHLDAGMAVLRDTEFLVLDEVDQMLDLGFIKAIHRIVKLLPAQRQNLFFSATMPTEIGKLAAELLRDPVKVSVAPVATTVERVEQKVVLLDNAKKREVLVELFGDAAMNRALVFTRTKRGADKVALILEGAGISTAAIHGNKSQSQRERSLASFRAGRVRALVATDIAARGIDVDSVSHVVNFDLPEVPESYVHRIGRTARAGAGGTAISLCAGEDMHLLRAIEKLTRQELAKDDRRDPNAPPSAERPSGRGNFGGNKSGQPPRRHGGDVQRHRAAPASHGATEAPARPAGAAAPRPRSYGPSGANASRGRARF